MIASIATPGLNALRVWGLAQIGTVQARPGPAPESRPRPRCGRAVITQGGVVWQRTYWGAG